jgi:hypothetical protein
MAMPGSYVYAMARGGGLGSLMRVSSDDDEETLVEYLQLDQTKTGRKQASAHGQTFVLERVGGGSSYEADPTELWSVDHMVRSVSKSKSVRVERVTFDYEAANAEISQRGGGWEEPRSAFWASCRSPESSAGREEMGSVSEPALTPRFDEEGLGVGGYSPFAVPTESAGDEESHLEEAVADLSLLASKRHASNRGPEGRVQAREMTTREQTPEGERGAVQRPCQYLGMTCGGCQQAFQLGEMMEARQTMLVHCTDECRQAADRRAEAEAGEEVRRLELPTQF